jgi:hypothetical protein
MAMREYSRLLLCFLIFTVPARAEDRQATPTQEIWDAAYLGEAKIGYLHTLTRTVEREGKKYYRTSEELSLSLKRYENVNVIRMESGTEEDSEGKVVAVFMTQYPEGKKLVVTGKVNGDQLEMNVDNGRIKKNVPWNNKAVGNYRIQSLFRERKAKSGDEISFACYEPTISSTVTVRAKVKKEEEVDALRVNPTNGKVERVLEKLLRVETKADEVQIGDQPLRLPGVVRWLNKDLESVRFEFEMEPLGKIVFYRTTKAVATAKNTSANLSPDIGLKSMIRLNRAIPRPHETSSVIYRITVKDDDKPETALAQDARQKAENIQGHTFELHVHAVRAPSGALQSEDAKADDKFLQSSFYIDSDNEKIKELAGEAVGKETAPWKKAQAIERWVHAKMRVDSSVAFCTASHVAEKLCGDCRHCALLTTAMCRAAGVPSRTALGLVYVNRGGQRPEMGFHMWTEVWIKGQWIGLDATLGQGSIGATHIKISDHSWHDVQSLTPMLPVARVLGKLSIEVIRSE